MTDPTVELRRVLSLPLLTFYGLGTILGAGIYVLIGEVVVVAGMHAPLSFLVAALLAVFTAFSYAELAARFPRSAGEAVYVQEAFHRRRLSLWLGLTVALIGSVSSAVLAHGFVGYGHLFFQLAGLPTPPAWSAGWLPLLLTITSLGLIAAIGIRASVWIATLITLVEVGGLLWIIWVARSGFTALPQHGGELLLNWNDTTAWSGVLVGAFLAFYAYIGFEDMVNVAEEVKRPRRTLPTAILLALVISTLLYVLVALVAVLSLPLGEFADTRAPLARLYQHATGQSPLLISLISMVAVINGALIQIIMASRVLYGLSWQGWLPRSLSYLHPRTQTPLLATGVITLFILVLALWLNLVTLAKVTSLFTLLVFALVNLALWRVKRHDRHPAGVRVYPRIIPLLGFVVSIGFIILQIMLEW